MQESSANNINETRTALSSAQETEVSTDSLEKLFLPLSTPSGQKADAIGSTIKTAASDLRNQLHTADRPKKDGGGAQKFPSSSNITRRELDKQKDVAKQVARSSSATVSAGSLSNNQMNPEEKIVLAKDKGKGSLLSPRSETDHTKTHAKDPTNDGTCAANKRGTYASSSAKAGTPGRKHLAPSLSFTTEIEGKKARTRSMDQIPVSSDLKPSTKLGSRRVSGSSTAKAGKSRRETSPNANLSSNLTGKSPSKTLGETSRHSSHTLENIKSQSLDFNAAQEQSSSGTQPGILEGTQMQYTQDGTGNIEEALSAPAAAADNHLPDLQAKAHSEFLSVAIANATKDDISTVGIEPEEGMNAPVAADTKKDAAGLHLQDIVEVLAIPTGTATEQAATVPPLHKNQEGSANERASFLEVITPANVEAKSKAVSKEASLSGSTIPSERKNIKATKDSKIEMLDAVSKPPGSSSISNDMKKNGPLTESPKRACDFPEITSSEAITKSVAQVGPHATLSNEDSTPEQSHPLPLPSANTTNNQGESIPKEGVKHTNFEINLSGQSDDMDSYEFKVIEELKKQQAEHDTIVKKLEERIKDIHSEFDEKLQASYKRRAELLAGPCKPATAQRPIRGFAESLPLKFLNKSEITESHTAIKDTTRFTNSQENYESGNTCSRKLPSPSDEIKSTPEDSLAHPAVVAITPRTLQDNLKGDGQVDSTSCTYATSIPKFWLRAMKNHEVLNLVLEKRDEPILEYLRNIRYQWLDNRMRKSYRIIFEFAENPYFETTELIKEFNIDSDPEGHGDYLSGSTATKIKWKPEMDPTKEYVTKTEVNYRLNQVRDRVQIKRLPSFFNLFKNSSIPDEAELRKFKKPEFDRLKLRLLKDHEVGMALRDNIIPKAINWHLAELHLDFASSESSDGGDATEKLLTELNEPSLFDQLLTIF